MKLFISPIGRSNGPGQVFKKLLTKVAKCPEGLTLLVNFIVSPMKFWYRELFIFSYRHVIFRLNFSVGIWVPCQRRAHQVSSKRALCWPIVGERRRGGRSEKSFYCNSEPWWFPCGWWQGGSSRTRTRLKPTYSKIPPNSNIIHCDQGDVGGGADLASIAEVQSQQAQYRQQLINELVGKELDFIQELRTLASEYLHPLLQHSEMWVVNLFIPF